jgi:thiamine-monophosphate kinase
MRERDLLRHIYQRSAALGERVTLGPGDDMGGVRFGDRELLVTVDQVADGVHFHLAATPLDLLARKCIVRNLSDVAAMAAVPVAAVAAAALPQGFGQLRADELFEHLQRIALGYDCPLIGGDVTVWDQRLLITITVFADPGGIAPVRRSTARPGDRVYVTGELGGAWDEQGGGPHLTAEPRLALARALARSTAVGLHAMIDLSDGLATDLRHICEASGVAAEIEVDCLPCRDTIRHDGRPPWRHALTDGEDYELCFTADGEVPETIAGVPIRAVGRILPAARRQSPIVLLLPDGGRRALTETGWQHDHDPDRDPERG